MHPRYRSILRTVFTGILQSGLTASDLRILSMEFRRGRIADELAHMLDQANSHFSDANNSTESSDELKTAERWIKEKRISKADLLNVMGSINPEILPNISNLPVRGMLNTFLMTASVRQSEKLLNILQAASGADPFLKGISERSKGKSDR
jgi:hypothetical protein